MRGSIATLVCLVLGAGCADDDASPLRAASFTTDLASGSDGVSFADSAADEGPSPALDTHPTDTPAPLQDAPSTPDTGAPDSTAPVDVPIVDHRPSPDTDQPDVAVPADVSPDVADVPDLPADVPAEPTCGDHITQPEAGETCDDGNQISGDGCRSDCILEEPIGAGFSGGQCQADEECAPPGSVCIPGVGGGSCSIACATFCDDAPGAPVTFCIPTEVYESRLGGALPGELGSALCVAKCDFERFPRCGCRQGLHCEQRSRYQSSVVDEVCVPGAWSIGLALSPDGGEVLGLEASEPAPAEPFASILQATCGAVFEPLDASFFRGLADTLSAMGPDGHERTWEPVCNATSEFPNLHELHAAISTGRAFRLSGSRLEIVDWSAAAIYGSKAADGTVVGGPLYPHRAMVHRNNGETYLYADDAADHPHPDPARGRHFGWVDGREWGPLDAALEPGVEVVTIKANGGGRFYRQWGKLETIAYLAEMALDHLITHGTPLGIGDISLPPGGDIDDHGSHETGRDADLYLLTLRPEGGTPLLPPLSPPMLWVAECDLSGGWDCWYRENATGDGEELAPPGHVPAATQLTTLAQFAYDNPGMSHFVQHDVNVLGPFDALPGSTPQYIDASNDAALGWPPHRNHVHVRFAW